MVDTPEISIDYSLTYREFVAGYKLAVRQSIPLLLFNVFARYIASGVVIVLVLMCLVNITGGHAQTVPPILPLILLISVIPASVWLGWRYSFRRLKINPKVDPEMTFQANESSFGRQIHKMGELTWLWSATHSVSEDKKVVVISVRRGCFIVLPRRVLTDGQILRLKELLSKNKGS